MTNFQKRPIAIVAGGAGFIGFHLCRALLAKRFRVICVDSLLTGQYENVSRLSQEDGFEVKFADIAGPMQCLPEATIVFNLACAASPRHYQVDPVHTMLTNVVGTANLLALATSFGARFVQASTSEVYGDPDAHPQTEGYHGNVNPTGPRACYDEGKRAAEALIYDYRRTRKADVRVARIFNTYGPRMRVDDGRVISSLVTQALSGREITIFGDGKQTRSFCYVSDMVEGLLQLAEIDEAPKHPLNLGNPEEITISELAELVLSMTGSRSRVTYVPLPTDDPRRRRPDISAAQHLLEWSPTVPLAEGLKRTIAHFATQAKRSASDGIRLAVRRPGAGRAFARP